MTTKKLLRCKSALKRLEKQLESEVKPSKEKAGHFVLMTDNNRIRAKKEINILKSKIK